MKEFAEQEYGTGQKADISFDIPKGLMREVENFCRMRGLTPDEFTEDAIRRVLDGYEFPDEIEEREGT